MARGGTLTSCYPRAYTRPSQARQIHAGLSHDRGDACASSVADNGTVAMLEGLLVVGIVGVLLYLAIRALLSSQGQEPHPVVTTGHWRTAHYDVDGHTKVVVQKVTPAGTHVLDEHFIAEIAVIDPDYDELFMTAMATARQRKAIFE